MEMPKNLQDCYFFYYSACRKVSFHCSLVDIANECEDVVVGHRQKCDIPKIHAAFSDIRTRLTIDSEKCVFHSCRARCVHTGMNRWPSVMSKCVQNGK